MARPKAPHDDLHVVLLLSGKAEVEDDMEEIAQDLYDYVAHLSEKCLFESIFTIFHKPRERVGITRARKGFVRIVQVNLSLLKWKSWAITTTDMGEGLTPCWTDVPNHHSATSPGAVSIPGNYYYSTEDYYYDNITATPATYVYELDSYEVSWVSLGIPLKNRFFSPKSLPQGKINGLKLLIFRPQSKSSEFKQCP